MSENEQAGDRRVRTPTVLQMEAVECGAACLGSVLGYFGRFVPLEELRIRCGVSRDGSKASNVLKAARQFGLAAKGFSKTADSVKFLPLPLIVFWNFNHFVVVEGIKKDRVYLNDPASGPRVISWEEFNTSFTGVVLVFQKTGEFQPGGRKRTMFQSFKERLARSKTALAFLLLASLFLVIPGMVIPTFSRIFVDDILVGGKRDWFIVLLVGMGLTGVLKAGLTWIQQYYLMRFDLKLAIVSSGRFFWHVLRLPMEFFSQRFGGEIGGRVGINDKVARLLAGDLATNILNAVMIVFFVVVMFNYDILLTLLGICIAFVNLITLQFISRKRVDGNQRLLQERGKLMGTAMGGLQQIETLKASGQEADFFSKWAGYHAKSMDAEQKLGFLSIFLSVVPSLLAALNTVAILGVGGLRVMNGAMSMGMLVAFQALMGNFIGPVNELVGLGTQLQEVEGDMKRLDDVFHYPVDPLVEHDEQRTADLEASGLTGLDLDTGNAFLSGRVELRSLTFGYSKLAPPLIEDFNLHLEPGARVALVGSSGCGKSTLAKLISGLYEPWEGEILFDGKLRRDIPRMITSASLAMVDQDIFLFSGSIRDNLTLWDKTIPDKHITQAARDACIHDVITERPGSYDSEVSEGGSNFSGGQRQRLEIARALVGQPTILVMDEATSALDPLTEKTVDENIRRRGCTCIIVAHRLSTIRDCNEIIVLDTGKVVERGTHEDLMRADGYYARLIRTI